MNKSEQNRTITQKPELSGRQLAAIHGLLEFGTVDAVARKLKISRSTLYSWLNQELFRSQLEKERKSIYQNGLERLKAATEKAAEALIQLLESKDRRERRFAAKDIINFAIKAVESQDLEERISHLEELLERNK